MHGNWGEWTKFHQCDVTCGGGKKIRTRLCNNPAPSDGGADCLLSDGSGLRNKIESEKAICNTNKCKGKVFQTTLCPHIEYKVASSIFSWLPGGGKQYFDLFKLSTNSILTSGYS